MWVKFKKKHTLNFSITSVLLVIILISLFVMLSSVCTFLTIRQWKSVNENAASTLGKTRGYINSEIGSYLDNSITLTTNPEFLKILRTGHKNSSQVRIDMTMRISNFFDMIPIKHGMISPSFAVYSNNDTLYSSKYIYDISQLPNDDILKFLTENKTSQPLWQQEDGSMFVFYILIDASKEYTNILRVHIDTKNINSFIETAANSDFYLTLSKPDENANIISSSKMLNERELYCVIPKSVRNNLILRNYLITLAIFALLSGMFFIIVKFSTNKMTKDIYSFIDNLNNENSLLNLKLSKAQKYSEFEAIKNKVIELMTSLEALHSQLDAAEKKRQEIEFEVTQSKFNPHLLYNTLSVIKWNVMRDTTEKIGPLIDLLTNYYRNVLNQTSVITLSEELILTEQYVHIMEFAHTQSYTLELDIDSEMKDFKIMKHTLQPLVENAILHGLNQRKNAIIKISAYKNNNQAVITVRDNGYGMTAEKIEELKSNDYNSIYKSYGIRNTKNRLLLYFGNENFDFSITSEINSFTEIKFSITLSR